MTARAISTASISFGLVSVPVKLYSSGDSSANISFNWLHRKDGSRLKQQYICAAEGVKVEKDEMVKGYEFAKDQYVVFSDEELKALEAKSDNTIEIREFVPADQVQKVYLDKLYYLGPDKGGDRAYRLLSEAMRETGLSALGQYAARGKQYLVLLTPQDGGLLMEQLRYADEVRSMEEVPLGNGQVKDTELQLAVQLIQQHASETFEPQKYKDEVRGRTMELIQRKVEGEDITQAPSEEPRTQIIDLMEALKASLSRADAEGGETERKAPKRSGEAKQADRKRASGEG
jgi:DNA end-binding protein Ku